MSEDLCYLSVSELSDKLEAGEVCSVELTQAYLERAESLNGRLNSVLTFTPELAMEQARVADEEMREGKHRGPLHGIPYGVKDLLDTKGIRTTWGSGIFANRVPDRDSAVVEKLTAAGAVLIAKLHMSEFAGGATRSKAFDYSHNPWKLDRSTSGSSSGSGAATAASQVAFSIGSETGGSIVGPSASCGVSGLRPTYRRVSRFGCMSLAWSLDKLGPMARSAEDCGLVLEAIAGPDARDHNSAIHRSFRFDPRPAQDKRIGLVNEEFQLASADNLAVFARALDVFRQQGMSLDDVALPEYPYQEVYDITSNSEGGTVFKPLFDDGRIAEMYTGSRRAAWMAASMLPASDYLQAQRIRAALTTEAEMLWNRFDVLVAPTRATGAPPLDRTRTPSPAAGDRPQPKLSRLANLAGLPGISIPCGFDRDGLPLALHIVGAAWDEQTVLDVAMAFQRETDFHRQRPSFRH